MGNVNPNNTKLNDDNKKKKPVKEDRNKNYLDGNNKPYFKGGKLNYMTTTINMNDKLFINEIVGMRTLRSNLSECISKAINNFQEVVTANNAVKGGKTASIISTDMLKMMLDSCIKFNTIVTLDEATSQYVASVAELDAYGQGDTKEEAIGVLLDNVVSLTEDYFENVELYLRIENSKKMLPYFERIRHCENIDDITKVLGLDII